MSPLLVYPDPPPPELAQSLDLAGFSWKAVANSLIADEQSLDHEWSGAVIVADENPNDAFAFARSLRKKSKPQQGILLLLNATQLGQLELRDELFDDFILTPFRHQELEARLKHLFWSQGVDSRGEILTHGDLVLNLEVCQRRRQHTEDDEGGTDDGVREALDKGDPVPRGGVAPLLLLLHPSTPAALAPSGPPEAGLPSPRSLWLAPRAPERWRSISVSSSSNSSS